MASEGVKGSGKVQGVPLAFLKQTLSNFLDGKQTLNGKGLVQG